MDEEYGVTPPEEESWREYPDGDIPIEEFTLDEMAEEEPPEDLYSASEDDGEENYPENGPEQPLYTEGYEDPVEWEEDPPEEERRRRPNLLSKKGKLRRACWATTDVFEYNKEYMRRPSRRKEWEFYQLSNSRYVFQVTYGHTGYAGLAGVTLVDFTTGERFSSGKKQLFPGDRLDLDFSGGQPHSLKYEDGDLLTTRAIRMLYLSVAQLSLLKLQQIHMSEATLKIFRAQSTTQKAWQIPSPFR